MAIPKCLLPGRITTVQSEVCRRFTAIDFDELMSLVIDKWEPMMADLYFTENHLLAALLDKQSKEISGGKLINIPLNYSGE